MTATASARVGPGRSAPVLAVENLCVSFASRSGPLRAVDDVSLEVRQGETVAIVGESGCGKTMTALAILGLVPPQGSTVAGRVVLEGAEIGQLGRRKLRRIRGAEISMIFQEPVAALNPLFTIGQQISDVIRAHDRSVTRGQARSRAVELLQSVGIADASVRVDDHPHQWSGGMCQRAMIAMAIANQPQLVIADEPTTSLDVTVQAQVLAVLKAAQDSSGAAILLITHDLGVVAEIADRVVVMYAGRVVETGTVEQIFSGSSHPYTMGLLGSVPRLEVAAPMVAIPGQPPQLDQIPPGCAFHPRCSLSDGRAECRTVVPRLEQIASAERASACHFADEADRVVDVHPSRGAGSEPTGPVRLREGVSARPILSVQDLVVHFPVRSGVLSRPTGHVAAVDGVTLQVGAGETLGLVGESGCGKSTTAHAIVRLVTATAGTVLFGGIDVAPLQGRRLREIRKGIQIVFQDPHASFNPKMRIGDSVAEPLRIHGTRIGAALRERVVELLELVGLASLHLDRYPHQLSGGQLQRVGIARALALDPQLLVLDEPVSSLDVSIQAQVLNLLADIQTQLGIAYLFISHDLSVVRQIADRVAVMYRGRIVETGPVDLIYRSPQHPYTRLLLDAIPQLDPRPRPEQRNVAPVDVGSSPQSTTGCGFRHRCPAAQPRCEVDEPVLIDTTGHSHESACHFPILESRGADTRDPRCT